MLYILINTLKLILAATQGDNIQASQETTKEKGEAVMDDHLVARNLYEDFDGTTSERAIMIGVGYPCEGGSKDQEILGT